MPIERTLGQHPRAVLVVSGLLVVLVTSTTALAQTNAQASITGVVTDQSGAVLPGVTVTASSPSLQLKQVTAVSEDTGEYRISNLPLGTYEVTYALDGFQMVKREDVRLSAGFTARVDVALRLGAVNETITVSGASPVIDVASSTPKTALTRETLELIPTSRNGVQALLAQAPGTRTNLDVGGNTAGAIPSFRAFGQSNGSWPVIEGIAIAQPSNSSGAQSGVYLDYAGFEEAQVSSVGNDAETPTRGIQLSMLMKSGGNTYHGGLMWSYTNSSLISDNIDAKLAAQGIRGLPIKRRWDIGGDVGGYAKRDRVWFYFGTRERVNDNGVLDCVKPDGTGCDTLLTQRFYNSKVTYQINSAHRLIGFYQWNLKHNVTGASALIDWGSRFDQQFTGNVGKTEWQGTIRKSLLVNALVGFWNFNSWQYGVDTGPSSQDIVKLTRWGSSSQSYFTPIGYIWTKYQVRAALSWYGADRFLGDHNVKGGLDLIDGQTRIQAPEHENGNYQLLYSNGTPFQVQVYNFPIDVRNADRYYGFFLKDEWRTAARRLTLSLGARVALDRGYVPAQSHAAGQFAMIYPAADYPRVDVTSWNTFAPRLRASWDVTNDGKTVLKGGWGRFVAIRGADDANYVNRNVIASTTFRWRDLNGNRNFDFGETNLDPNGLDFVSQTGTTLGILNPDEKPPISDEFSLSVERQLVPDVAVRATGIYSKDRNNAVVINPLIPDEAYTIPVTNRDPGPDGVVGNADDPGTTMTYWEYPTSYHGAAFQANTRVNDPRLDATYRSFELALSKRLSHRWQAMLSYSWTRLNAPGNNAAGVATPNTRIFADNGSREWSAKASGAYQLPFDLLASLNYELRSGAPWQRTVLLRGGIEIPTIVLPVEPIAANYYDNLHLLDARARKDIRYGNHRLGLGVDVFNLLNVNTVTSMTTRSGPSFGLVTTAAGNTTTLPFIPGRNVQFTLNYTF